MQNNIFSKVIEVLRDFGGYYTFSDDEGVEYVVIQRDDFEALRDSIDEVQLALPAANNEEAPSQSADDLLERINRDIALFQLSQEEQEEVGDIDISEDEQIESESSESTEPVIEHIDQQTAEQTDNEMEPPRRVRFEPIHGDLPPELQE